MNGKKSLLSSQARIQAPWIKVTIGDYTFGVFDTQTKEMSIDSVGICQTYQIQYPQYIKGLQVLKINGQVNNYTLDICYPVTQFDDPNFFEKVFSSISRTRKITFTYGDAETPGYVYKNEEAIITDVSQTFDLMGSTINYVVKAISSAALTTDGSITKPAPGRKVKPSDEIKKLFKENKSLQNTFTGMTSSDLDKLVAGDDAEVYLESKQNISALDYINYLAGCMVPSGTTEGVNTDIYILTIYDDSVTNANRTLSRKGPYFTVSKVSAAADHRDAYEIDIGVQTSTIVRSFSLEDHSNYAIYYDFQSKAHPEKYVRRINSEGNWEDVYAPTSLSRGTKFDTKISDSVWWSKVTQFPITAVIKVQGLLRPAALMQYVKLNVIFPGGKKHISSGLYIITRQVDEISESGYLTTLTMTRIKGDS